MHISHLGNKVFKVADVVVNDVWNKVIKFEFCVDHSIQTSPLARIYVLTSDGEIIKIGGSADKGGIAGTLGWYAGGFSGNPDDKGRTLGVPLALRAELDKGRKVEVYMTFAPTQLVTIPGITEDVQEVVSGFKQMETLWVKQYIDLNKKAPILNMQEAGSRHPEEVLKAIQYYYSLVNTGASISGKGKKGRVSRPFTESEKEHLQMLIKEAVDAYSKILDNY